MINHSLAFIRNLLLPLYDPIKDYSDQNWFNTDGAYKEKTNLVDQDVNETGNLLVEFNSPVEGTTPYVTSPYGWRILFKGAKPTFHTGTDFRAEHGSGAFCVEDCKIIEIVRIGKYSNRFEYRNGKHHIVYTAKQAPTPRVIYKGLHTGNIYKHMHCQRYDGLRVGKELNSGEFIGHYGNYGYSLGPHCHFEVHINMDGIHRRVNPRVWLKKRAKIIPIGRIRAITVEEYKNFEIGK